MATRRFPLLLAALCAVVAFAGRTALAHDPAVQALRAQTEPATTFVDAPETLRGTVREIVIDDATRHRSVGELRRARGRPTAASPAAPATRDSA